MTAQPSGQPYPFDVSPILRMYMELIEIWKKNYENFVKSAKDLQTYEGGGVSSSFTEKAAQQTESAASAYDAALLNWQKSSEELFKRFVQNQIEICRFFGNRWEQYLKLPDQISNCRSITELGNVQTAFLSQFANDYVHETEKLAKPVAEAISNLAVEKKA